MNLNLIFKIFLSLWLFLGFFSKIHINDQFRKIKASVVVNQVLGSMADTTQNEGTATFHLFGCHFCQGGCLFNFTTIYTFNFNVISVIGTISNSIYTPPEQKIIERPPIS